MIRLSILALFVAASAAAQGQPQLYFQSPEAERLARQQACIQACEDQWESNKSKCDVASPADLDSPFLNSQNQFCHEAAWSIYSQCFDDCYR